MNKSRRKAIEDLIEQVEVIKEKLEEIREEEDTYYDCMPESFRNGEKGERAQEIIDNLDDAMSSLEDATDNLTAATE